MRAPSLARLALSLVAFPLAGAVVASLPTSLDAQRPRAELGLPAGSGELRFDPPEAQEYTLPGGVTVFFVEDHELPLVDVYARFRGGYARFPREFYAAGTALPSLLRTGGTESLTPRELEKALEFHAISTTFGGAGGALSTSVGTLTQHLDTAVALWSELLQRPRFDSAVVELWRGQSLEGVRRRGDDPGRLAFSEYNRLMYPGHPVGWELDEADLAAQRVNPGALRWLYERIICRENLILGVSGDVSWARISPLLTSLVEGLPACAEPLPPPPEAAPGATPGVYFIPRPVNQSVVVAAHSVALRQGADPEYFASRIGNAILGASGMGSRLMQTIRTREGLAYGASSLWTTPRTYDGLLGATTRVRSDATVDAITLLREALREMALSEPGATEVETNIAELVNGFAFNFQSPSQIVTRRMAFRASELPDDWLTRYVDGIQAVTPTAVREAFAAYSDPSRLVILIVGNPGELPGGLESLEALGPVTILSVDGVPQAVP